MYFNNTKKKKEKKTYFFRNKCRVYSNLRLENKIRMEIFC